METPVNSSPARPAFSSVQANHILTDHYRLSGDLEPLPSDRDQNFLITREGTPSFVLKFSNSDEDLALLQLQNEVLEWLAESDPDLPIPRLIPTFEDASMSEVGVEDGNRYLVRLLSYLPGGLLSRVNPRTPELLEKLGSFMGRLDLALQGYSSSVAERPDFTWNLLNAADVIRENMSAVDDPARRALLDRILLMEEEIVQPVLPSLRRGLIHNDANDYNVLVDRGPQGATQIVGLIDFGDILENPYVCELAITIAYGVLGKSDPLGMARHIVRGYHEAFPLTEEDLEVLFPLVCLRLGKSVSLSAKRSRSEPDNPYLTVSEAPAWAMLERLQPVHPNFARNAFRGECGFEPCPRNQKVVRWLEENPARLGRLIDPELTAENALILDLSVETTEFSSLEDLRDAGRSTEIILRKMEDAENASNGAEVAIGRYDEARPWYSSEAYETGGGEFPETRTVHLAVDLFLPAGAPLYVPLDAVVHSVQNNKERLDYGPTVILRHTMDDGEDFYTLYGHLMLDSVSKLKPGGTLERGTQFAKLGDFPENGDWAPHVHFQIITDLLGATGNFPGVGAPRDREVWRSICPDPNLILRAPFDTTARRSKPVDALVEQRSRHISPSLRLSYDRPLHIVRGHRQFLYDPEGRTYLDCVNNVCHVGHCHPGVVEVGQRQMAALNTNTRYLHQNLIRYTKALAKTLPEPLSVCFIVNSGSEANELALRLARAHTGGTDVVVVDGGYHGNTGLLVGISSYKFDGPGGEGRPHQTHTAVMPDDYRGPYRRGEEDCGKRYAEHVRDAFQEIRDVGRDPSAFICESLLSCGGQIELPDGYLRDAYEHARAADAICIADEIQVGFGRVGTHFWGFETHGVVPDIVTMGKPIGNGHPLGAVVTTPDIAASFANGMEYFNTFGGNPVSCAIGLEVLKVIEEEGLQEQAKEVGEYFKAGLAYLKSRHPVVGDVRGRGLFLGIELVRGRDTLEPAAREASYVVERMKDHGILLSTDGPLHNVIKIKPPLVFRREDTERVVSVLDRVLGEDPVTFAVSELEI